jgi:hypothetical protein
VSEEALGKLDPEDGGGTFFRNIGNHLLFDTLLELQSSHGEDLLIVNLYRTKVTFAVTQVKVKCLKNSGRQWT